MLQNVDLTPELSRVESQARADALLPALETRLGELQRKCKDLGIPVIIVFEGWKAAGKGTLINKLMLNLDPRGFTVYPILEPTEEERLRPYLWRFWTKTPAQGRIALFDHSWYSEAVEDRVSGKKGNDKRYREFQSFEKQLADEGAVIVKFFLQIDKK